MNLGKVKTFLIVLFLGINIYLVISSFMSTRFLVDNKTVQTTIDVLEKNQIKVDKKLVMKTIVNLKNIDTNNIVYTDKFRKSEYADFFEITNDNFSFEKSSDIYSEKDSKIKKEIETILEKSGFETKYMKFGNIHPDENGDKEFTVKCLVKNYEVFDSKIKVVVSKDKITLKGMWYEPLTDSVKSKSRSRETVYVTSILVSLIQNEEAIKNLPIEITDIDYGYLAGTSYGEGVHVTTSALPYYRIKDSKNNVYYYDAKNGSYLK